MPYGMTWGAPGGNQDDEFTKWLQQFMPAKVNPVGMATTIGGGLLGKIADWIGGGQARKDQSWGRTQLKAQYGKDVLNPYQIAGQRKLSFMNNLRPIANTANRRLGLNSGQAWEQLMSQYGTQEGDFLSELMLQNALAKSERDRSIAGMFYGGR